MPETYTLPRDGQRALRFEGTVLAAHNGAQLHGRAHNRYYTLTLYRTACDGVVVHWDYVSQWQGEASHDQVRTYATLEAAITALEAFDPCAWLIGYRPQLAHSAHSAAHYLPRQQALERSIRERYKAQVTALCQALQVAENLDAPAATDQASAVLRQLHALRSALAAAREVRDT